MSKEKRWIVSVLESKRVTPTHDADFFTSDTDANLVVELADENLDPLSATILLYNHSDQSLIEEDEIQVNDRVVSLPLYNSNRSIIEHKGTWAMTVIFIYKGKKYTSRPINFYINGYTGDEIPEKLELVENWNKVKLEADAMKVAEAKRVLNEEKRSENEVEREQLKKTLEDLQHVLSNELANFKEASAESIDTFEIKNSTLITNTENELVSLQTTIQSTLDNFGTSSSQAIADFVAESESMVTRLVAEINRVEELYSEELIMLDEKIDSNKQNSNLSIAKLKKDLQSYKNTTKNVNVNQEAWQITEGRRVINLPETAGAGHASFGLKGLTATNVVKGRAVQPQASVSFDALSNNQYYNDFGKEIFVGNGTTHTITNTTEEEVDILVVDLTQTFGIGNEPTKEECANIFNNYFDGTQSVSGNVRVKSGESTLYLNAPELYSLPNGVRDEVQRDMFIKRIGKVKLKDLNINSFEVDVSGFSNDRMRVRFSRLEDMDNYYVGEGNPKRLGIRTELLSGEGTGLYSGEIGITANVYVVTVVIKKEWLETLSEESFYKWAEETDQTVIYSLDVPKQIPIHMSGDLTTQPNGTAYAENVNADVAIYADKVVTELPIKKIDQLSVVDTQTGVGQKIEIAKAVVAADRLSFTHPDLNNGDIVFFDYYYEGEFIDGLANIKHFDSRYTITDSVTGQVYRWSVAVSDGEPSVKLEEI